MARANPVNSASTAQEATADAPAAENVPVNAGGVSQEVAPEVNSGGVAQDEPQPVNAGGVALPRKPRPLSGNPDVDRKRDDVITPAVMNEALAPELAPGRVPVEEYEVELLSPTGESTGKIARVRHW